MKMGQASELGELNLWPP